MTATDRLKRLRTGIPSTFMVQDQNARAVLDAIREAVLLLTDMASVQDTPAAAAAKVAAGVTGIVEGTGIQVEDAGGGAVRITCTVTPGTGGGSSSTGVTTLAALTDVALSELAAGNALIYNATTAKWENWTVGLSNLGDATITSPTTGQVLFYNATTAKWENGNPAYTLAGASDATIVTPSAGQVLMFDAGVWKNMGLPAAPGMPSLDDLTNVNMGTHTAGESLVYANGKWSNVVITALNPTLYDTQGTGALGSEGPEGTAWVSGATNGCWLWVETRQRYYSGSDKIWYAYARKLIFDKYGMLYSASAEQRFAVETPVTLAAALAELA